MAPVQLRSWSGLMLSELPPSVSGFCLTLVGGLHLVGKTGDRQAGSQRETTILSLCMSQNDGAWDGSFVSPWGVEESEVSHGAGGLPAERKTWAPFNQLCVFPIQRDSPLESEGELYRRRWGTPDKEGENKITGKWETARKIEENQHCHSEDEEHKASRNGWHSPWADRQEVSASRLRAGDRRKGVWG